MSKTSLDQFGVYPLAKMFFYFDTLTWSPTFNFGYFSLTSLLELIFVLPLTPTGFILIVLWYVLFYSFTISSNQSFFDTAVIFS